MTLVRRCPLRAGVVLALVVVLAACASSPELRMAGSPGTTAAMLMEAIPVDTPISFGGVMLCVSAPSNAAIRAVAVHQATGDIEVQAFAVRLNPFTRGLEGLGNQRSTIADLHLDFDPTAPASVSGTCPDDAASSPTSPSAHLVELAVQVARRSGEAAGGPALDVTYELVGDTRTAVIPVGVWLCASTCPPEAGTLYRP